MNISALNSISYGMYVIGAKINEREVGCFVNTVIQVTAENPIISVSINKQNYTNEVIRKTNKFSVSVLSEETDSSLIGKFGFFSSRDTNKFENVEKDEMHGLPILTNNICANFVCEVLQIIDAETHDIFVARVIDTKKNEKELVPMTYNYYHRVIKGKAPKTAPTYREEEEKMEENVSKKYRCTICGYIYDDAKEATKFEDLPEDWKCPLCGAPKKLFEEIA